MKRSVSILGCGWLGKPLGEKLVANGYRVLGSTTTPSRLDELKASGIEPYLIVAEHGTGELMPFLRSDVLIIAVPPKLKARGAEGYLRQIRIVSDAIAMQAGIKTIFISSTSVYSEHDGVAEEKDADPSSVLLKAEQDIRRACSDATILRFAGMIGPDRHPGRFLSGKKEVPGARNPVNLVRLADCVNVIFQIMQYGVWGETMNVCSDDHPSREIYYTKASLDLQLEPPQFKANDNAPFKIVSSEKLKQILQVKVSPLLQNESLVL
jgi:nucleoside-diphosphate-sugar epimerase